MRGFGYALFYFQVIKMDFEKLTANQRIVYLRKNKNINQKEMAKLLGKKVSTYSQKERIGSFTAEDIKAVCEILNIDPYIIIFGKPHPMQEMTDLKIQELEKEIEEKYRQKYEKYETISRRDLRLLKLMNFLSREKQDMVFEYAYALFKKKRNDKDPA